LRQRRQKEFEGGLPNTRAHGACALTASVIPVSIPGNLDHKINAFGDDPVELFYVILFFLAIIVGASIIYYRMSGNYEVKVVGLRKNIDALEVENRKLKHEVNVLTEKNQALVELREKELEREEARQAEMAPQDLTDIDPKDVVAELLRSNVITVADIEKINKYKRDAKSDISVEELLVVLDVISHETLVRTKRAAARRRAKTAV
jgi:hypothetical protein